MAAVPAAGCRISIAIFCPFLSRPRHQPRTHHQSFAIEQHAAAAGERRPVPPDPADDAMTRDHTHLDIWRPCGKDPFLDSGAVATVGSASISQEVHNQAD